MELPKRTTTKQFQEDGRHIVDILFVLVLFGIFATSALLLVTLGANVYKQTVAHMNENYEERTAYAYLTEKIRQNNENGSVSVAELEGTPALVFTSQLDTAEYSTYLYFHDGYLKELSLRSDSYAGSSLLSAGQSILPLAAFSISPVQNNLIKLRVSTNDGSTFMIYASLCGSF